MTHSCLEHFITRPGSVPVLLWLPPVLWYELVNISALFEKQALVPRALPIASWFPELCIRIQEKATTMLRMLGPPNLVRCGKQRRHP